MFVPKKKTIVDRLWIIHSSYCECLSFDFDDFIVQKKIHLWFPHSIAPSLGIYQTIFIPYLFYHKLNKTRKSSEINGL